MRTSLRHLSDSQRDDLTLILRHIHDVFTTTRASGKVFGSGRTLRRAADLADPEMIVLFGAHLRSVFSDLMGLLMIETGLFPRLSEDYDLFFEKAEARIADAAVETPTDIDYLRKVFKHPSGIVVSTCHGVKGEEYDTVICFGLLKGYIPNWQVVINDTEFEAHSQAAKLLYVVCSRAKRHLHLIAESGRITRRRNPYETTQHLSELEFDYDTV